MVLLVSQSPQDVGEGEDREVPRGRLRRRQGIFGTEAVDRNGAGREVPQKLEEMKHLAVREVLPFQDAEEPRLRLGDGKHDPIGGGAMIQDRCGGQNGLSVDALARWKDVHFARQEAQAAPFVLQDGDGLRKQALSQDVRDEGGEVFEGHGLEYGGQGALRGQDHVGEAGELALVGVDPLELLPEPNHSGIGFQFVQ